MPSVSLSLYCPPMPIRKVSGSLRITDAEPMEATITLPGGQTLLIAPVTIPQTMVRRNGLLNWTVDACTGYGENYDNSLTVNLPPEDCKWSWSAFTMVAEAIDAPAVLELADGSAWEGRVSFPDCRLNLFTMTAEPVTAFGILNQTVKARR